MALPVPTIEKVSPPKAPTRSLFPVIVSPVSPAASETMSKEAMTESPVPWTVKLSLETELIVSFFPMTVSPLSPAPSMTASEEPRMELPVPSMVKYRLRRRRPCHLCPSRVAGIACSQRDRAAGRINGIACAVDEEDIASVGADQVARSGHRVAGVAGSQRNGVEGSDDGVALAVNGEAIAGGGADHVVGAVTVSPESPAPSVIVSVDA